MNDTELILNALKMGAPEKPKKKQMKPIFESSGFEVGSDAIFKPTKRARRSTPKREKPISQWGSWEFAKYFYQCLSQFGIEADSNITRDSNASKRVYDMFVDELGSHMTNYILRDYIEWWVGTYARARSSGPVGIFSLMREQDIQRFLKQHSYNIPVTPKSETKVKVSVSPEELYNMSGLGMVVMAHGIVEAYRVLIAKGQPNVFAQLSDVLKGCSKQVLAKVLDITLGKRYNAQDKVDFLSVARPALKFHGIEKKYDDIDYTQYFTEA